MTNEEMAAKLLHAGWRVKPPLTQENCEHPDKIGQGAMGSDGSSSYSWHCRACGKSESRSTPANPKLATNQYQCWN